MCEAWCPSSKSSSNCAQQRTSPSHGNPNPSHGFHREQRLIALLGGHYTVVSPETVVWHPSTETSCRGSISQIHNHSTPNRQSSLFWILGCIWHTLAILLLRNGWCRWIFFGWDKGRAWFEGLSTPWHWNGGQTISLIQVVRQETLPGRLWWWVGFAKSSAVKLGLYTCSSIPHVIDIRSP